MLSQLVVHMVVHPEVPRDRARMIMKWIGVMKVRLGRPARGRAFIADRPHQYLRQLNNFSSLMALVAGLNNSAVLRLKKTMAEVLPESLKVQFLAHSSAQLTRSPGVP